jgi:DNA-binding response OmpR family regulator
MEQNILLVDDEEALRMTVGDRLRKVGYAVDCAPDGETGFQKATSRSFDLMIFDVMLPGRSGLDLCRDIRHAGLGVPILLLTARSEHIDQVAGFNLGADAYVTKPFDMLELMARVEALLRRAPGRSSNIQSTDGHQKISMHRREGLDSGTTVSQRSSVYPITSPDSNLRVDLDRRLATHKNSPQLAKVIPRLRKVLDEERLSSQTPREAGFLSVAGGVIGFLEEMFEGIRSSKRRR